MAHSTDAQGLIYLDGIPHWSIDGRVIPVIGGGDGSAGAPAAAAPAEEQATGEETAAPKADDKPKTDKSQPSKAKDKGPSPWLKDLEGLGLAPEHLSAVDEYLGSQWQPRMTQFEQEVSEWSGLFGGDRERAEIMANIANALEQDPEGTYRQIGELLELVGPDDAEAVPPVEGDEGEPDDDGPADDPRLQFIEELMNERQEQQSTQLYDSLMERMRETYKGLDEDLFNMALLGHGGDVEAATAWYEARHKDPEPTPEPPPTSGEPVAPTPPETKKYGSNIGDAVTDWVSERRTARSAA